MTTRKKKTGATGDRQPANDTVEPTKSQQKTADVPDMSETIEQPPVSDKGAHGTGLPPSSETVEGLVHPSLQPPVEEVPAVDPALEGLPYSPPAEQFEELLLSDERGDTAEAQEPEPPSGIMIPMPGEGVAAFEPLDGIVDGVLPERPQYESVLLLESLIDYSPRNHREEIDEEKVQQMAANMRELKYVIGPITVRIVTEGRYELVVGELRLRAARVAGIVYIPAVIRQLSDEQVDLMQLAENHHRHDPHIMAQARKVASMVNEKKSIKEIGIQLGMSASAVYTRYHLANLIPDFERLFRADILKTSEVLAIATLSHESQQELFEENGKGWEVRKSAYGSNIPYIVSRYRCDFNKAIFDMSENDLVPGVKSCHGCRFNLSDAGVQTLFDDPRITGRCGNAACFDNKTWAAFCRNLAAAIRDHSVTAIVFDGGPSEIMEKEFPKIPGATDLKRYDADHITLVTPPIEPSQEEYVATYGSDTWTEPYELAHAEYEHAMGRLTAAISEGQIISGLSVNGFDIEPMLFTAASAETEADDTVSHHKDNEPPIEEEQPEATKVSKMTTEQIREAIVEKTVDVQLLRNEINSIQVVQSQAERDDKTNTARAIHAALREKTHAACKARKITATAGDKFGLFMILYEALSYKNRAYANEYLFGKHVDQIDEELVVKRARKSTPEDLACLVRLYFAYSDQAKLPGHPFFGLMRETAQGAGVNVKKIEADAAATAEKRRKRNAIRIAEIKRTIANAQAPAQKPQQSARKVKTQSTPKGVKKSMPKPVGHGATGKRTAKAGPRKKSAAAKTKHS